MNAPPTITPATAYAAGDVLHLLDHRVVVLGEVLLGDVGDGGVRHRQPGQASGAADFRARRLVSRLPYYDAHLREEQNDPARKKCNTALHRT